MYRNSDATLKDAFGFIAKVLRTEQVPEPLRKEAAGLLVATGWMVLLPGVEDDIRKLLKDEEMRASSVISDLYDGDLIDERV